MSTRLKVYERLGLEYGSLKHEGGNDWVRAVKEIEEEEKKEMLKKMPSTTSDADIQKKLISQTERHNREAEIINERWRNK